MKGSKTRTIRRTYWGFLIGIIMAVFILSITVILPCQAKPNGPKEPKKISPTLEEKITKMEDTLKQIDDIFIILAVNKEKIILFEKGLTDLEKMKSEINTLRTNFIWLMVIILVILIVAWLITLVTTLRLRKRVALLPKRNQ